MLDDSFKAEETMSRDIVLASIVNYPLARLFSSINLLSMGYLASQGG